MPHQKILSAFLDESGDFGQYEQHSPYYLVSLVLHDQTIDISQNISDFETHTKNLGYEHHAVHTGPLIRRESDYINETRDDRIKLFNALFHFVRKTDIKYSCVKVNKRECADEIALNSRISKQLGAIIQNHLDYFTSFDKVIVYYDNGQIDLTKIITSVFSSYISNVEFRKVQPVDYKLFQAADMICTIELLADKAETKTFSKSESDFFCGINRFKKNYLKWIIKKKL